MSEARKNLLKAIANHKTPIIRKLHKIGVPEWVTALEDLALLPICNYVVGNLRDAEENIQAIREHFGDGNYKGFENQFLLIFKGVFNQNEEIEEFYEIADGPMHLGKAELADCCAALAMRYLEGGFHQDAKMGEVASFLKDLILAKQEILSIEEVS